ncbi:MAG: ketopantoate reductase family protein [Candidatus Hodarchaeales archaeon]|jgi:2-dehydropantoate 2-reductase
MNISVIGAGSIGSLFAGRMAYSGFDVDVVGRKPHVSKIQEDGLIIKGEIEQIKSFFPAYTKLDPSQYKSDALFITTKAYDNEIIAKILANRLKKQIPLFLIQNGMGNEDIFQKILPDNPIYRAVTTEAAEVIHPGTIKHVAFGKTSFGTIRGNGNGFGTQIKQILSSSGFMVKEAKDIHLRMWYKLLANIAICPLGAILHAKNGEILKRPSFERIFNAILEEGIALANIYLPEEDFSQTKEFILKIIDKTRENKCSMLQDIERGRRTEIDFMNGFIARESQNHGLKAPVNAIITDLVRYIERNP